MSIAALFGLSVLMSFLAFGIVTKLYIWPRLRVMSRQDSLTALVVLHTFRFIGLSFLVPGVVSPSLSSDFAAPAAYGDLIAAIAIVWVFNVWGALDLLNAIYNGQFGVRINPASLGAAFYIPTVIVPALLTTHGLIFWILLRPKQA
jgi:hypothetical protein